MTIPASLLDYLAAVLFDLNVVLVAARCEVERMPETVGSLCRVLAEKILRCVTAIAHGDCTVRRLEPTVVLLAHDVTIGAGCWIIG
jgi:hypothetical protein